MTAHPPRANDSPVRKRAATLIVLFVLMGAVLAAVPGLRRVVHQISHVDPLWIVLAIALEVTSALGFVVVFRLFIDRGPPRELRRMAWTELAVGALLPAGGTGGLAVGAFLMSLARAPTRWVVRRSEALFFVISAVLVLGVVVAGLALIAGAPGPHDFLVVALPTAIALLGAVAIAALPRTLRSHPRAPRWLRVISAGVEDGEKIAFGRRSWRLLGAVGYLCFDMAVLWVALKALGRPPSVPALMMAYTIGNAASAVPVPGGIGVLDAGLTGALVLYGVSSAHAAAAVLVYHAVALWVPGIGGLYAYLRLRPRLLSRGETPLFVTDGETSPSDTGENDDRG